MKITVEIKADKSLIKAITDLKDELEKANAISIPKVWVNERPVITTGGTWPPTPKEGGVSTAGSYDWRPQVVEGTSGSKMK